MNGQQAAKFLVDLAKQEYPACELPETEAHPDETLPFGLIDGREALKKIADAAP